MKQLDLTVDDIESAIHAMESWLDGPGDDDEFALEAEGVRKVLGKMRSLISAYGRALTLVPNKDEVH